MTKENSKSEDIWPFSIERKHGFQWINLFLSGEDWWLLPQKALFQARKKRLIIADIHLGKAPHFRKSGVAVPSAVHSEDYKTMQHLLNWLSPREVFFLGDLFHSHYNESWEEFSAFLDQFPEVAFRLIKGNHDILPQRAYENTRLKVHEEEWKENGISFRHEPVAQPTEDFIICGHIHPAVTLTGKGRAHEKLPCFYMQRHQLILPAFGAFTGTAKLNAASARHIFVIVGKSVLSVR